MDGVGVADRSGVEHLGREVGVGDYLVRVERRVQAVRH